MVLLACHVQWSAKEVPTDITVVYPCIQDIAYDTAASDGHLSGILQPSSPVSLGFSPPLFSPMPHLARQPLAFITVISSRSTILFFAPFVHNLRASAGCQHVNRQPLQDARRHVRRAIGFIFPRCRGT